MNERLQTVLYVMRLVAKFPSRRSDVNSRSCGICDGVIFGNNLLSKNFGFPCQLSFHKMPHICLVSGDSIIVKKGLAFFLF
jgi:hypothetical protein